jgi:hypothetical protein|eukprot:COSAG01_NODE_26298_length_718_cov_1.399031_1_plen_82_part_00
MPLAPARTCQQQQLRRLRLLGARGGQLQLLLVAAIVKTVAAAVRHLSHLRRHPDSHGRPEQAAAAAAAEQVVVAVAGYWRV